MDLLPPVLALLLRLALLSRSALVSAALLSLLVLLLSFCKEFALEIMTVAFCP